MITCGNFLSENARPTYERILDFLSRRAGERMVLVNGVDWQKQNEMFDTGEIQLAFICGLPYSERHDRPGRPVELLAAPVMAGKRYAGRPVYFTDVIVRADSPMRTFADLRGKSWAYNGSDSNSGYNIPRDHLLALGETRGYFDRTVESGSHQRSIQMVVDGDVDASGIDSLVLDMEMKQRPELEAKLRVIESIGPCPVPPVVVWSDLPTAHKERLREGLLYMHTDPRGREILDQGMIDRFVAVSDQDYDPVREMARRAHVAGFLELK